MISDTVEFVTFDGKPVGAAVTARSTSPIFAATVCLRFLPLVVCNLPTHSSPSPADWVAPTLPAVSYPALLTLAVPGYVSTPPLSQLGSPK